MGGKTVKPGEKLLIFPYDLHFHLRYIQRGLILLCAEGREQVVHLSDMLVRRNAI